ncbi:hypothetical protein HX001_14810 [Empedobacter brevis]|uniref:Uncharacterized protein n=1 Tax=Empedobacter brevis TaxID=247 RepID=A0AAJ1QGS8_9FLAO|nr:hypothetical protein [Empedobacter brevis]MDM1073758.1 hypothetical protein [Empedobacter brevis]QHC85056.1 hypothetical protein AS589_09845 [Empedobacter brevis]
MKLYINLVFIILTLFSCNNKTEFEKHLINNKWVYNPYDKFQNNIEFNYYLKFYDNYSYKNYFIKSNVEFVMLERTEENLWKYNEKNKILTISNNEFRILSINKTNDTISMKNIKTNKKSYLFKLR